MEWVDKLRRHRRPKVVIIGGSHSGFSCAWMLLHGPAMYHSCYKTLDEEDEAAGNKEVNKSAINNRKVPQANRKSIKNCIDCCSCGIAAQVH